MRFRDRETSKVLRARTDRDFKDIEDLRHAVAVLQEHLSIVDDGLGKRMQAIETANPDPLPEWVERIRNLESWARTIEVWGQDAPGFYV